MADLFQSINPFTAQPVSAYYVRMSVFSRPGKLYRVSRLDGSISWNIPCESSAQCELSKTSNKSNIVGAEYFQSLKVSHFGTMLSSLSSSSSSSSSSSKKRLWVIGGTHGNERNGVLGVKMLRNFLENPRFSVSRMLFNNASISLVDCINRVGYAANARFCPRNESMIEYDEKGKHILIEPHQHTSLSPPPGWQDPNRGWHINKTLVKDSLMNVMEGSYGGKPDWMLFTHDWAAFMPKVAFYEKHIAKTTTPKEFSSSSSLSSSSSSLFSKGGGGGVAGTSTIEQEHAFEEGLSEIFSRFYPRRTGFGKKWSFTKKCYDNITMTSKITELFDIPTVVVENYLAHKDGAFIHMNIALYLLAKQARLDITDEDLVKLLLHETSEFLPSNYCAESL